MVDLAYRDAEGWHLIDWKTDQASIDVMALRHRDQFRAYASGWVLSPNLLA